MVRFSHCGSFLSVGLTSYHGYFLIFSVLGLASVSDYGGSVNGLSMLGIDGPLEKRRAVLNLYLLNNVSPMLMLIRSAWSNYLLVRNITNVYCGGY